jgi:FdrA protein
VSATIVRAALRRSAYYDSVTLMQAQQSLRALPGIVEAGVVMGTEANLELLRQAGLDPGALAASADDLIVAVRGDTEEHVEAALASLDALLRPPLTADTAGVAYRPRSVAAGARLLPGANLALISVPGRFAAPVARQALEAGLHVMLFSDNVPLEDEVRLKQLSQRAGLLCMGPDCGTALIGGAALGFANRVRQGPIGCVAAAGTGLQEVVTIIHRLGGGVSHGLGTGGRDLTAAVGGATMIDALTLFGRDPSTTVVVLVSKPPDPGVAKRLLAHAVTIGKPVVVAFVGCRLEVEMGARQLLYPVSTLEEAGLLALRLAGGTAQDPGETAGHWRRAAVRRAADATALFASSQRYLRGLYSGGTLCAECIGLLHPVVRPLYTNTPIGSAQPLDSPARSRAHTVLDLGADDFTVGRLHPMLDMTLRAQRFAQEAADPEVAVILLDVVLGEGVHPDPAGVLSPLISDARRAAAGAGRALAVVASVCGTDQDPQNRSRQVAKLQSAGVLVEESNARAAAVAGAIIAGAGDREAILASLFHHAADRVLSATGPRREREDRPARAVSPPAGSGPGLLGGVPHVVNVGLGVFAESLRAQGVPTIDLSWQPPAAGDRAMMDLLERLE